MHPPVFHRPSLRSTFVVALVAALVALAACDGEQSAPAPGPSGTAGDAPTGTQVSGGTSVGVVLPPVSQISDGEVQRLRVALATLEQTLADDVAEVRVVRPDADAFRSDLATLLAGDGMDLVCVLGTSAATVAAEVALAFPRTRFCAAPAVGQDLPGNVIAVDVRIEDIAFLAGVAVRAAMDDAPAALVGRPADAALARLRDGFEAGVRHAGGSGQVPVRRLDNEEDVTVDNVEAAAAEVFAEGVAAVYAPVGAAGIGAVRAAAEAPAVVPSPPPTPGADPTGGPDTVVTAAVIDVQALLDREAAGDEAGLLVAVGPDYGAVVRRVVEAVIGGEDPAGLRMGIADGAVAVVAGGHPRSAAAFDAAQRARVGIITGSVPAPSPN